MRVTSQMIMDSTLYNIQQNQNRIEQLQAQITSGSRISKPSDDPIGAAARSTSKTASPSRNNISATSIRRSPG